MSRDVSVSVVIPLYNKARYIGRAVNSALQQQPPPAEVIVVDDGSTDGGGDYVRMSFPAVHVLRQDNKGVGAARNAGLTYAKSEWVAFLDADDYWLQGHVEEVKRIISNAPNAHLVSTQYVQVFRDTTPVLRNVAPGKVRIIDYFAEASRHSSIVWTSSAAVRRELLDKIGGFTDCITGEDLDYWIRIALCEPVAISTAQTAVYVRGIGGVIETRALQRRREPLPTTIIDVWPYCGSVVAALERDDLPVPRSSLISYLNSRVILAIRQALVRGEIDRAKVLREFLRPPVSFKNTAVAAIPLLPPGVVRLGLRANRFVKRVVV